MMRSSIGSIRNNIRHRYNWAKVDSVIISYPKCGRTWLRAMLGSLIVNAYNLDIPEASAVDLSKLAKINRDIPKIIVTHDNKPALKKPEELSLSKRPFYSKSVVFLSRDPRDALVSLYYHFSKRSESFDGSMSDFIRGRRGGLDTFIEYHNQWINESHKFKSFHLVRYEDLIENTKESLRNCAEALGLSNISDYSLDRAIEFGKFNNMRSLELSKSFSHASLASDLSKGEEALKTRKGKVGSYVDDLSDEDIKYCEERISRLSNRFNYKF